MQQRSSTFVALIAVGVFVAAGWYVAGRSIELPVVAAAPTPALASGARRVAATPVANRAPAVTSRPVAQWIADTTSGDAGKRAAAIAALAEAPRAEALPVLGRILTNGEPQVDRPLALSSLRDLALNQGDADGAIRDAVRQALYHGDDQTRTDDVQEVLDIIEESELK